MLKANYHELKGALLSLMITDWSKAMLLRDLDQIYESVLTAAESQSTGQKEQGNALTAP